MSFLDDLAFGEGGEQYFVDLLKEKNIVAKISAEPNYDILVESKWVKCEVKADRRAHKTGNLCLELFSHIGNLNPGWMQYSIADILVYLFYDDLGIEVKDVKLYDLHLLRSFVFWSILGGDWFCSHPLAGKVLPATSNPNVRNLILPVAYAEPFKLYTEHLSKEGI